MKDKEEKLREAAEKWAREQLKSHKSDKDHLIDVYQFTELYIAGAKSESAKQYHSQEPVDVSRLREQWEQLLLDNDVNTGLQDVLFDFFLPHLSQHKESDAVEFAEWCHLNGWTYNSVSNDWYNTTLQPFKTSDELYHQYQTSKLKSDG